MVLSYPSMAQKKALEEKRAGLPRFLFRGYHCQSGGGYAGLNSHSGIVPHAYLHGQPRPEIGSIYDIPDLRGMVQSHLQGGSSRQSEFSSWSASIDTSLKFARARCGDPSATLAIIDTTKLSREVSIYYTPDLQEAGVTYVSYPYEYLAHGPVEGPGLVCVALTDLAKQCDYQVFLKGSGCYLSPVSAEQRAAGIAKALTHAIHFASVICPRPRPELEPMTIFLIATWLSRSVGFKMTPGEAHNIMVELLRAGFDISPTFTGGFDHPAALMSDHLTAIQTMWLIREMSSQRYGVGKRHLLSSSLEGGRKWPGFHH